MYVMFRAVKLSYTLLLYYSLKNLLALHFHNKRVCLFWLLLSVSRQPLQQFRFEDSTRHFVYGLATGWPVSKPIVRNARNMNIDLMILFTILLIKLFLNGISLAILK